MDCKKNWRKNEQHHEKFNGNTTCKKKACS
jgi:hypothetical protein